MKQVEDTDPTTRQRTLIATFALAGDHVVAHYRDDVFREDIEVNGIYTMELGTLRPNDGRAFYDALDAAYSRSSFRRVVTVE